MKTSEYKCPWEPRADDQEVSKENRSAAKEQLGIISNTYKSSNFKDFPSHLPYPYTYVLLFEIVIQSVMF